MQIDGGFMAKDAPAINLQLAQAGMVDSSATSPQPIRDRRVMWQWKWDTPNPQNDPPAPAAYVSLSTDLQFGKIETVVPSAYAATAQAGATLTSSIEVYDFNGPTPGYMDATGSTYYSVSYLNNRANADLIAGGKGGYEAFSIPTDGQTPNSCRA